MACLAVCFPFFNRAGAEAQPADLQDPCAARANGGSCRAAVSRDLTSLRCVPASEPSRDVEDYCKSLGKLSPKSGSNDDQVEGKRKPSFLQKRGLKTATSFVQGEEQDKDKTGKFLGLVQTLVRAGACPKPQPCNCKCVCPETVFQTVPPPEFLQEQTLPVIPNFDPPPPPDWRVEGCPEFEPCNCYCHCRRPGELP